MTALVSPARADTYTIDFFPELPQSSGLQQLIFVPRFVDPYLVGSTITQTRLVLSFTTSGGFDAAGLDLLITARVDNQDTYGVWEVTGADLGWSGQGTFTADITTAALNGTVLNGVWSHDLSGPPSDDGPLPYSGEFTADSRIEVTYAPVCRADFGRDGTVGVQDIFDFLAAWFEDGPGADFNRSGAATVQDLFDFLSAWFAGC